jgi:hypothetical protein
MIPLRGTGTIILVTMVQRVEQALRAVPLGDEDAATKALALHYARDIDGGPSCEHCDRPGGAGDLAKLGPALLACLESLGLSPRARTALKKGATDGKPRDSKLDQLAAARARKARAANLDAAAP